MRIIEEFEQLARQHNLLCRWGLSPIGDPEVYLYSHDMRYRYAFARWWGDGPVDLWIGLNPATGDTEKRRRPTLDKCIAWSRDRGRTGIIIANLFAYRATKPKDLQKACAPIGEYNDAVLKALSAVTDRTIVAWGGHRQARERAADIRPSLNSPLCVGVTANGEPRHPLFVKQNMQMQPFGRRLERALAGSL